MIEQINEEIFENEEEKNEDVSSMNNHFETLELPILEQNLEMNGHKGISVKFQCFYKQN